MVSERLKFFLQLQESNIIAKVQSFHLENEVFQEHWNCNGKAEIEKLILYEAARFPNNRIFVHPCPIDECRFKGYSFAGVYKSYKPYRSLDAKANVHLAVEQVMNSRFSYFAEFYYRNLLEEGKRDVDLFISCENDDICGFGTGYVDEDKCVFQIFNSPLSMYRREAIKYLVSSKGIQKINDKLLKNITRVLFLAQEQLNGALDVEFVIDKNDRIIVNEVRAISNAHLTNWNNYEVSKDDYKEIKQCQLNTVGKIDKRIRLWDEKFRPDDFDIEEDVLCVNYKSDNQIFELLSQLEGKHNMSIILVYPFFIVDNHFSYTLHEYNMFDFILRCTGENFKENERVIINSNGLGYDITRQEFKYV